MKHSVLCVDDEINILNCFKRNIRGEPYKLFTTTSPDEALEIVKTNNISLVISDYRMPEMNGVDLLIKIKNINPKTMRIILSGYAESKVILEAINKGEVCHFFTKPWDEGDLKKTILECLRKHDELNPTAPSIEARAVVE